MEVDRSPVLHNYRIAFFPSVDTHAYLDTPKSLSRVLDGLVAVLGWDVSGMPPVRVYSDPHSQGDRTTPVSPPTASGYLRSMFGGTGLGSVAEDEESILHDWVLAHRGVFAWCGGELRVGKYPTGDMLDPTGVMFFSQPVYIVYVQQPRHLYKVARMCDSFEPPIYPLCALYPGTPYKGLPALKAAAVSMGVEDGWWSMYPGRGWEFTHYTQR